MNVIGTAALLIFSLLAVPIISVLAGTALGTDEWQALHVLLWVVAAAWLWCFSVGQLTGNVSQVDKLWSVLPIIYVWIVAGHGDFAPRLVLMAVLVSVWGVRLTWNFSRHGAYTLRFWRGHEDYRWQVLREKPAFQPAWKWTLFNLFFISGYQNALILLMTLPTIVALQFRETPLGVLDMVLAAMLLLMIGVETIADNQQWRYQSAKKAAHAQNGGGPLPAELERGFLDSGLWAWSRHPNYLAEQTIWVAFYGFSIAASGQWVNWSIAGCLLLIVLFRSSSAFSEEISAGKYPAYAKYQRTVPRFVPFTGRGGRRAN